MNPEPIATSLRSEWESLVDVLAGFLPEHVPVLAAARELEMVYPLLHALTRGGLTGFYVRVAALESLLGDGRGLLKPHEAAELLYWLKEPDPVLRTLRDSGWIEHEPGGGYRVTDQGRFVATVLSFLRGRVREQTLLPTVEGVDYMIRCGIDPVRQLVLLRSQLEDLRRVMEVARSSHSSVLLRQAAVDLNKRSNYRSASGRCWPAFQWNSRERGRWRTKFTTCSAGSTALAANCIPRLQR